MQKQAHAYLPNSIKRRIHAKTKRQKETMINTASPFLPDFCNAMQCNAMNNRRK